MGGPASQVLCHLDNQHSEVRDCQLKERDKNLQNRTNQNNQQVVEVSGFSDLVKIAELSSRDFLT